CTRSGKALMTSILEEVITSRSKAPLSTTSKAFSVSRVQPWCDDQRRFSPQ
ncbi:hypothetical protein NDU88_001943, partial [Pleurodeles waltl]